MFVIVYEFTLKNNAQQDFISLWNSLTTIMKHNTHTLGARLFSVTDSVMVAQAEWPTKAAWEDSQLSQPQAIELRERMMALCEDIQIIYQLDLVSDQLGYGSVN
jgi:hypothetical protein